MAHTTGERNHPDTPTSETRVPAQVTCWYMIAPNGAAWRHATPEAAMAQRDKWNNVTPGNQYRAGAFIDFEDLPEGAIPAPRDGGQIGATLAAVAGPAIGLAAAAPALPLPVCLLLIVLGIAGCLVLRPRAQAPAPAVRRLNYVPAQSRTNGESR